MTSSDRVLPKCGDVTNCFDCFQQQECVTNPFGGAPLCTPCGWCTSSTDDNDDGKWWDADVEGKCVMAPLSSIDFCKFTDSPASKRYCPDSVCQAGQTGCVCEDNVCPAVEKILSWLSVDLLWAILLLLIFATILITSACIFCVCCRPAPRQILLVSGYPIAQSVEQASSYSRMA